MTPRLLEAIEMLIDDLGGTALDEALRTVISAATASKADKRDAERYRWLQKQEREQWEDLAYHPPGATNNFIDAAIAAQKGAQDE